MLSGQQGGSWLSRLSSSSWLILVLAGCVPHADAQTLQQRMLAAEDARVATDAALAPLLEGLRSGDEPLAVRAARGLGRFERPGLVRHLLPLLADSRPAVRREAANALGQSLASVPRAVEAPAPPELAAVTRALLARLRAERDPSVAGTIAETLGRLPHRTAASVREAEDALRGWLSQVGAFRGMEALIRFNRTLQAPEAATIDALRTAATLAADAARPDQTIIRRVAWLAVNAAGAADLRLAQRGSTDPDPQVRRQVVIALGNVKATNTQRRDLLLRALKDPSFHVRTEAVRVYSQTLQPTDCAPVIAASDDANAHVVLAAIDALGNGCAAGPNPRARLMALADNLPPGASGGWHFAARAIVALARTSRDEAAARLGRFAEHPMSLVRASAARAAAVVASVARLQRLAGDPSANVRYEALTGLRQVRGHRADAAFVEALASREYHLVLAAAEALEGTANTAMAVPALVQAFTRLTAERRHTSRDPRLALLARLREMGSAEHARALEPCLTDIDPMIAVECSATLQKWTGVRRTPKPAPSRPDTIVEPLPTRARVVMRGGRDFAVTLLADEAPASVFRFAKLARAGYYNGLTFHRVVPNFIIQGGSPGGNEYSGDGPFMRDELGLRSHARGTIGVSTRGRDTGDAQIFVNLLDNPRLDHEFTVFAEVVSGMDVVDEVLEGDVIDRVEILATPAAAR
jgi:cyclophilin family peptidyl-prolyl cis-trans isomerase/HEAT repeat protein